MPGRLFLFAVFVCLCGAACARPYAAHLPAVPWTPGATQSVTTKTLAFSYQTATNRNLNGIRGSATILPTAVPPGATRYERIVLKVYVRDDTGRVLDTYTLPCLPRPVSEPIGFELLLDIPPDADRETYYLSFGYSLVLKGDDPDSPSVIRQEDAGF